MSEVRLVKKILIAGRIEALTGLHIGGSDVGLTIGGADKVVIRDPRNSQPYVPGSSLKGKMRSLLERSDCAAEGCLVVENRGGEVKCGPCECGLCAVCHVFGVAANKAEDQRSGASRLLVRDAFLRNAEEVNRMPGLDMPFTEIKTEVSIDRITSAANPRQFERVPAGASFAFELVLNVFEGDEEEANLNLVKKGLSLVAHDGLGGQVSRGYGQVQITLERLLKIAAEEYGDPVKLEAARENNLLQSEIRYGGRLLPAAGSAA
jgi:CRISPR-associated protein Csm3